mmetsp:Transcript_7765/g.15514  ORF Transcript_7765/g.15514 Transcript_7765/m.15514 type:complete len:288 (-) Transcript_7765:274-1137(-)
MPFPNSIRLIFAVALVSFITSPSNAALEVIGSGYGRTGTDTLREALNELGYKTYHMREIMKGQLLSDIKVWHDQIENDCSDVEALRDMFEKGGWTAAVDLPASLCYERLMKAYPKAKVIHTERKSAEQWWNSASNSIMIVGTIFPYNIFYNRIPFFRTHKAMSDAMWSRVLGGKNVTVDDDDFPQAYKAEFLAAYEANNARVRKVVPRKRLLIQDHSKGWTDLCTFLNKEVPDIPYPHVNTLNDFYKFANNVAMKVAFGVTFAFAVFVLAVKKLMSLLTNNNKIKES